MSDTDAELRKIIAETKRGAAAIAVCIARTLAESDPTLPRRLSVKAHEMYEQLCERGEAHAGEMMFVFGRALLDPSFFPEAEKK
jgi:hypothetical protein